jgi:hypothetical protein
MMELAGPALRGETRGERGVADFARVGRAARGVEVPDPELREARVPELGSPRL